MDVDELIRVVTTKAEVQHGLIRTDQIDRADQARLRHLARRGVVVRVGRGVYRVAGSPTTWRQQLQAGVWSLGASAVVSHAAAAQLHGLDGFDRDQVEFTVDRERRGRRPDGASQRVHTTTARASDDRVFVGGLPTTSPTRTIVDLARDGARTRDLASAVDSALRLRLATLDGLVSRVAAAEGPGRRGLGRLGRVLVTSGGHSYLERRFLELVRDAGLPVPQPQVVHRRAGRHVARVDFEFVGYDVVVEVSGGRGHTSAADRAKDARRRNELQQLGRLVLEFTFEQVVRDPAMVVETLRRALADRGLRNRP